MTLNHNIMNKTNKQATPLKTTNIRETSVAANGTPEALSLLAEISNSSVLADRLLCNLIALTDRLSMILLPANEGVDEVPAKPEPNASPVASAISSVSTVMERSLCVLESINRRLDLPSN